MKLLATQNEEDRGTPIEWANAIIRWHMDRACIRNEDDLIRAQKDLGEIAEHIQEWKEIDIYESR